jgi:RimJ/RimL family protein N-acetyltransferase
MAHPYWPLFDLRIRTPRLELRPDDDEGLLELAEAAAAGVHDPDTMPFFEPWTDAPPGDLERGALQFAWGRRSSLTPQAWQVNFLIGFEGRAIGLQSIEAEDFSRARTVATGSWIGRKYQGQGIGKEMRAAVLHFAFVSLGAERAQSGAFFDNGASLAVSRSLGYVENGEEIKVRRDEPARLINLLLTRERWEAHRPSFGIEVEGLERCLTLLGAR